MFSQTKASSRHRTHYHCNCHCKDKHGKKYEVLNDFSIQDKNGIEHTIKKTEKLFIIEPNEYQPDYWGVFTKGNKLFLSKEETITPHITNQDIKEIDTNQIKRK